MIEVMTANQKKLALVFAILAVMAIVLNPAIVHGALRFLLPTPAGVPQVEIVPTVQALTIPVEATDTPLDERSIRTSTPATRPAIIGAKAKRIAEIRAEIAALVEELEGLLNE